MSNIASQTWVTKILQKMHIGKYSTDEVRVGTWIDGKPIYRKTFTVTPTTYSSEVVENFSTYGITNVKYIINGYATGNSGHRIPYLRSGYEVYLDFTSSNVIYKINNSMKTYVTSFVVTVEYIKTTD